MPFLRKAIDLWFPAKAFSEKFAADQEHYYEEDLRQLTTVVKQEHMQTNQLMENFK